MGQRLSCFVDKKVIDQARHTAKPWSRERRSGLFAICSHAGFFCEFHNLTVRRGKIEIFRRRGKVLRNGFVILDVICSNGRHGIAPCQLHIIRGIFITRRDKHVKCPKPIDHRLVFLGKVFVADHVKRAEHRGNAVFFDIWQAIILQSAVAVLTCPRPADFGKLD